MGVGLALCILNKDFIRYFIKHNNTKVDKDKLKIDDSYKKSTKRVRLDEDDTLISLVEEIEESGFIPSIKKDDIIDAA
tara:strand:- start:194 stop:427 length:234 start_codon:yes stop_codon:yes gene_type:complete